MVQTVDFFTPIVDDPYTYGQIAASNSLSDVYAMGGLPVTAMNVVGVPLEHLSLDDVNQILKGGADKIAEANCVLAGGHTVQNPEPLYGLSVTGLVHPDRLITNAGASVGDVLVLTKPIGTGILSTATKRGIDLGELGDRSIALMATLNTPGAVLGERGLVKGGTDVTGFGLGGHALEMAEGSGATCVIDLDALPIFDEALDCYKRGVTTGANAANREVVSPHARFARKLPAWHEEIVFDPQTSGGLLAAVPGDQARDLLAALHEAGVEAAREVGRVARGDGTQALVFE